MVAMLASLHQFLGWWNGSAASRSGLRSPANLQRAQIILGGLDEAVVQKIVSEDEC